MTQEAVPATLDAPTLPEPPEHAIVEQRLDAQGGVIAIGTAIASRQDDYECHRRDQQSEHHQGAEERDEEGGVGHEMPNGRRGNRGAEDAVSKSAASPPFTLKVL